MPKRKKSADRSSGSGPKLLSGGNPQISKGEGDEPVQAYIAAMPGWKRSVGERLDELIVRAVPGVHKAVKWNQPFYGREGEGWFLSFRCYTDYVQVQFFRGTSLDPVPPKASKHDEVRYFDIHEDDDLDEDQLVSWIEQASNLPGEKDVETPVAAKVTTRSSQGSFTDGARNEEDRHRDAGARGGARIPGVSATTKSPETRLR